MKLKSIKLKIRWSRPLLISIKWHVRTLLKDLDTAVKLSREQGSATPMSGLAAQLMRLHGSQGFLERDPATLVEMLREQCP